MKAIMYHYVRLEDPSLPYFRYLHVDDFVKQLDYFEQTYGFVSKKDFEQSISTAKPTPAGVILTFDDGFKDHYRYVLPELLKRRLWGIFYVPTSPLFTGKLIDVHRIHMLLGKYGGTVIADAIQRVATEDMLSHAHIKEFHTETYVRQDNNAGTNYVKRLLNYFIDYKYRQGVIDELMSIYYPNESDIVADFYMTADELAYMHANGMILGSHTVNHRVMSKLTLSEQRDEIADSFQRIESITGGTVLKTFCYPYGGFHTFTADTERLLEQNSCVFSFNVEHREIQQSDLSSNRQALPRFDCNAFPFGSCR